MARDLDEDTRVDLFATLLDGDALVWFDNVKSLAESQHIALTLQALYDQFILTYDGSIAIKQDEAKLATLTYEGNLNVTNGEFDRLAAKAYPGWQETAVSDRLMANMYQEVIGRGDMELLQKAQDAQPVTVQEWKLAVLNAYASIQKKKALSRMVGKPVQQTSSYSRPVSSQSSSQSSSFSSGPRPAATAKVQHTRATEREEGEPPVNGEEEVAWTEASKRPRSRSPLTAEQRKALFDLHKCWNCYEKNHKAHNCPHRGKPGYPPKLEEKHLKA